MTIRTAALSALLGFGLLAGQGSASAQERQVKLTGFGAMSGVVRSFGINSKAALEAAADQINKAGGVTLGDGTIRLAQLAQRLDLGHQHADALASLGPALGQILAVERRHADAVPSDCAQGDP